ncbi:hypothetical protein CR513_00819, partial [Mucuna pruriens]
MTKTDKRLKAMEAQISTLATLITQRVQGLPPPLQIEPSLKEEVKVITLRKNKVVPSRDETSTKEVIADVANEGKKVATLDWVNVAFPQRLKDEKMDKEFTRFLEIFRKLHINIPFIEDITQMSNYANFFKNIMSNKKKLEEFKVINLTKECYVVVLKKLSPKLKDLGCFTIPYTMGNSHFDKALYDLGASINLMHYFIFKKLDLQEPQPTNISS